MRASWREGCPVPIDDLRILRMDHWGFDGAEHPGELVVHRDVADAVLGVFRRLWDARFPIERMVLVDEYGASDDRSMEANNTSAFNCRTVAGTTRWSEHSYGRAIDLNPVQNPYVSSSGRVSPPNGGPYADRNRQDAGMVHGGDVVATGFADIGWGWGGTWRNSKDYQHFSASGR